MADKRRKNGLFRGAMTVTAVGLAALSAQLVQAGNTTCVSNQLSWYSDVVGESPCMTYQRLRQICNNDYQVPNFASTPPGDRCDDQVSECCCNMVAFQLSMLCMVCQQDHQDSGGIGIDAPVKGTYTVYRGTCGAGVNHTLPSDLQSAICNENIRIDNFLYDSWDDGTWFYVWTKENVEKLHAENNNNTFTHCPNQISPSATPTSTSTSTTTQQVQTNVPTTQVSSVNTPVTSTSTTSTSTSSRGVSTSSGSPFVVNASGTGTNVSPTSGASTGGPNGSSSNPSSSAPGAQSSDADFGAGGQSKSKSRTSIIGGAVGGMLGLLVVVLAGVILWKRRKPGAVRLQGISSDDYVGYNSPPTAPLGSLSPNRRDAGRPTSPMTHDDDPFVSMSMSITSPRTLGAFPTTAASAPLTESSLRHHDGGPLLGAGLTRSNSGRLPPAYEDSWDPDSDRTTGTGTGRRTHPTTTAGSESAPRSDFSRSEVSEGQSASQSMSTTSRYGYGAASRERERELGLDDLPSSAAPTRRRALPEPAPLALGATGRGLEVDAKDASLFD